MLLMIYLYVYLLIENATTNKKDVSSKGLGAKKGTFKDDSHVPVSTDKRKPLGILFQVY